MTLDPIVISRGTPNASVLLVLVEQWIHFVDTEVQPYNGKLLNSLFVHKIQYLKRVCSRFLRPLSQSRSYQASPQWLHLDNVSRVERAFNTLEKVLETKTFLIGECLTFADLSIVLHPENVYLDNRNISKSPSVVRFVETVLN